MFIARSKKQNRRNTGKLWFIKEKISTHSKTKQNQTTSFVLGHPEINKDKIYRGTIRSENKEGIGISETVASLVQQDAMPT